MMRLFIILLLLGRAAWAAPCAEDNGTMTCESFTARDQTATGGNLMRLEDLDSSVAAPTPKVGECVFADGISDAADAFTINCVSGLTVRSNGNVVQQQVRAVATQTPDIAQWQNAQATPLAGITNTGKIYATGMNIPRPYGSYWTITPVPTPASTTAAYAIAFDGEAESGLVHPYQADNSKVQVVDAGTYVIDVSAIVDLVQVPAGHLDIWLAVNGANVSYSNTKVELGTAALEMTLSVPLMYTFAAGDYFQLLYAVDDVDVQLRQVPATPSRTPAIPDAPAVIITVFKVSGN